MSRLVFLLEEPSMKHFLDGLLRRMYPDLRYVLVPHEGRSDLEKSIPRKLAAWREPGARFLVLRDNDGDDCKALKARLVDLCRLAGREDSVVRIACQELEAWYLGDLAALAVSFDDPRLARLAGKQRYRDPDAIAKPSAELARLIPAFQKLRAARQLGAELERERNCSASFQCLLRTLDGLTAPRR